MLPIHQQHDVKIASFEAGYLINIGQTNLPYFSKFVFDLYNFHYLKKYQWRASEKELYDMAIQDQDHITDAHFFGFTNRQEELLGTIKLTPKQEKFIFPIEQDFDIDLTELIAVRALKADKIWHLGRLAIDSNKVRQQQMQIRPREIMRLLLVAAFTEVDQFENSLVIAESDQLIYQLFHEMGINSQKVGEAKDYLGSPTYPIIITGADIRLFLQNIHPSK